MMLELTITTTSAYAEALSNQLNLLGAAAISWQDAANQPIYEPLPNECILWRETTLVALFEDTSLLPALSDYLNKQKKIELLSDFHAKEIPPRDWVRASLDQFTPLSFGKRLWICPSWHLPPDPAAVNVLIDPGLAFGTGTHPTTALCLEWLDMNISGKETIMDYGCGSGILAVTALKLGATHAIAVDHDLQALDACQLNAGRNLIQMSKLLTLLPEQVNNQSVDLLVANILAQPLIELAPLFSRLIKPGGKIALSGILDLQCQQVIQAYQTWFNMMPPVIKNEWSLIEGTRLSNAA